MDHEACSDASIWPVEYIFAHESCPIVKERWDSFLRACLHVQKICRIARDVTLPVAQGSEFKTVKWILHPVIDTEIASVIKQKELHLENVEEGMRAAVGDAGRYSNLCGDDMSFLVLFTWQGFIVHAFAGTCQSWRQSCECNSGTSALN